MSTSGPPSVSLVEAVSRYLEIVAGLKISRDDGSDQPNAGVSVFSYRNDFSKLWKRIGAKVSLPETLVIVWDDIPPVEANAVGIDTSPYLTPLDWAVACSLAAAGRPFRIAVVLTYELIDKSTGKPNSGADAIRWFSRHAGWQVPELPWVRVFRVPTLTESLPDLHQFLALLNSTEFPTFQDAWPKANLDLIRRLWSLNITAPTKPGDHHAITNLIGPLALLGPDSAPEDGHVHALAKLIQTLGLIPTPTPGSGMPWVDFGKPPFADLISRLQETKALNLVLLDDQVKFGWASVLCKAVGVKEPEKVTPPLYGEDSFGSPPIRVRVFGQANPQWLLDQLKSLKGSECRYLFRLTESEEKTVPAEVLFLDLRLFPGKRAEEVAFILDLITLAAPFVVNEQDLYRCANSERRLPWPGFRQSELDAAKAWASKSVSDTSSKGSEPEAYLIALTFLPRLLALTDCSLPIVLFSSTGRREIIEALKPHGNIITDFEKPRFFGNLSESFAEEARRGFEIALRQATEIAVGRQRFALFVSNIASESPINLSFSKPKVVTTDQQSPYRLELYIDETDRENNMLCLGGYMALYPPDIQTQDPLESSLGVQELFAVFRKYLNSQLVNANIKSTSKELKHNIRTSKAALFRTLTDSASQQDIALAGFSLCGNKNGPEARGETCGIGSLFPDEGKSDNLWRKLFRALVELVVYYWARLLLPEKATLSCKIFAPTRIQFSDDTTAATLYKDWGLGVPKFNTSYNYTVATDTPRLLLEDMLAAYQSSQFFPKIEQARAFRLNPAYYEEANEVRCMHFFADAVMSNPNDQQLSSFWENGFQVEFNGQLAAWLRAYRKHLGGHRLEAVVSLLSHSNAAFQRLGDWQQPMRQELSEVASILTGVETLEACRRITLPRTSQTSWQEGVITKKTPGLVEIKNASNRSFFGHKDCKNFSEAKVGDRYRFRLNSSKNVVEIQRETS